MVGINCKCASERRCPGHPSLLGISHCCCLPALPAATCSLQSLDAAFVTEIKLHVVSSAVLWQDAKHNQPNMHGCVPVRLWARALRGPCS